MYSGRSTPSSSTSQTVQLIEDCLRETEACVAHIEGCINNLAPGVSDLPRLSHVLQNNRRYLFVPEPLIESNKQRLGKEVEPQIEELVQRAERAVGVLERKEVGLKRKLANPALVAHAPAPTTTAPSIHRSARPRPTAADERKLAMLRGRKEKLRMELAALEGGGGGADDF